jgi:hypothetical protein
VFHDEDPHLDAENLTGYSFDQNDKIKLDYGSFLKQMSK